MMMSPRECLDHSNTTPHRLALCAGYKSRRGRSLEMQAAFCDGGQYSDKFGVRNALTDDDSVYSSEAGKNVNVILVRSSELSPVLPAPFTLTEVRVRIPAKGFTSPLRNGFLFICSRKIEVSDFDQYNFISTGGLLDPERGSDRILPRVPPYVLTVLYFQLDRSMNEFTYRFSEPVRNCRYLLVKLLTSFGARDSIDVEYIGFQGVEEKLCFPEASLL